MCDGEFVALPLKAIETLILLVQNPGKVLERETLMRALWADTIVEDANLTVAISQLRKAFGLGRGAADFIETVPRVGYRFTTEVHEVVEESSPLVVQRPSAAAIQKAFISGRAETSNGSPPANGTFGSVEPLGTASFEAGESLVTSRGAFALSDKGAAFHRISRPALAMVALVALTLAGVLVYRWSTREPKLPATASEVKSMAILPLKTLGVEPEDEYLGLGVADALITQLSSLRQIPIRPISAVQRYAGTQLEDPVAVGRDLHVEAVLEGTLQREGDRLRVTMRLLRVGDGVGLWSGKFDESFTNMFDLQDRICEELARASVWNLSKGEELLLTRHHTDNIQAYQRYLKGRYFWNKRTAAGLQRSVEYFNQAIAIDPRFALAYAGLADAYALLVWQSELPKEEFIPKAKAAATKALKLDETLSEAHTSLGFVRFWYDWDFARAESEYRRAVELNPDYATAHHWYGEFLVLVGRPKEGFKELKLAQEADPLSLVINADIGKMFVFTRQPDEAIEQLKKTLEMAPDFSLAHLFLAMAYSQKGMHEQAIAELEEQANRPGSRAIFKAELANIYARSGRTAQARGILNELKNGWSSQRLSPAFEIALICVGLGEKDQALQWLQRAKAEREPFFLYARTDPNFDALRGDSRVVILRGPQ